MDWHLVLTIGVQVLGVGILYGVMKTRIDVIERDLNKLEREVIDFRSLKEDMAVVKAQLSSISACLHRLSANKGERENEV